MTDENKLINDLEFHLLDAPFWKCKIKVASQNGIIYIKKEDSHIIYKKSFDYCECLRCGSKIQFTPVIHKIYRGPDVANLDESENEYVPFCPNCEQKPKFFGSIIKIKK